MHCMNYTISLSTMEKRPPPAGLNYRDTRAWNSKEAKRVAEAKKKAKEEAEALRKEGKILKDGKIWDIKEYCKEAGKKGKDFGKKGKDFGKKGKDFGIKGKVEWNFKGK